MRHRRTSIVFCIFLLLLGGCDMSNETLGVGTGAVVGGLVGSRFGGGSGQVAATAVGALLGAFIGGRVGKSMDKKDRKQVSSALENNKTGHARRWRNPDSGVEYTVKPTRTYTRYVDEEEEACREFTTTAIIGGVPEKVYGKACRTKAGWKIVEQGRPRRRGA